MIIHIGISFVLHYAAQLLVLFLLNLHVRLFFPGLMAQEDVTVLPSRTPAPEARPKSLREVPNPAPARSASRVSQRFYRAKEKLSGSHHEGIIEETGRERVPSGYPPPNISLLEARADALHTLSLCRTVITSLELTRMRKSRVGYSYWVSFWQRLYERSLAHSLGNIVSAALSRVDTLFRNVSKELHQVTVRMEHAVRQASSEREILRILELMEAEVGYHRKRRRKKAQGILDKMRANIEAIPVTVGDELVDDMKRGIFALDMYCDYHPGDQAAEERDRLGPEQFLRQQHPDMANAPAHYHRRRAMEFAPSVAVETSRFYVPAEEHTNSENGNDNNDNNDENRPMWRPEESCETACW